jgi:hypothetical protein
MAPTAQKLRGLHRSGRRGEKFEAKTSCAQYKVGIRAEKGNSSHKIKFKSKASGFRPITLLLDKF